MESGTLPKPFDCSPTFLSPKRTWPERGSCSSSQASDLKAYNSKRKISTPHLDKSTAGGLTFTAADAFVTANQQK
jgi:hypothetical protein